MYNEKNICDFNLYVITPKMTGVFSIAEMVDDVKFSEKQIKSLLAVRDLCINNGVKYFDTLEEIAEFLNNYSKVYTSLKDDKDP